MYMLTYHVQEDWCVLLFQRFPRSLRGVVLGFASRSLRNESAIVVTFGSLSSGYTDALARVFEMVSYMIHIEVWLDTAMNPLQCRV